MKIICKSMVDVSKPITDPKSNVKYLLKGEEAEIPDKKQYVEEVDLIVKSPMRQKVICPIFYDCGGCDLLHVNYEHQLNLKASYLEDLYSKVKYKTQIPIIKNQSPLHYRHKVVLSATTHQNKLKLGLYRENTKEIIPFLSCFLHDIVANKILEDIEKLMNQYKITAYNINSGNGILKHVLIRKSYHDLNYMVVFVTEGHIFPNGKKIIQELVKKHPYIVTIVQNIHRKKTHLVLLDEEKVLYGNGYIFDEIQGIKFRLSAKSFYQINPLQMLNLYQQALDLLNIKAHETIIDTYSGIGSISLLLAKKARQVIAIETNKKAHVDAEYSKKINNITNVTFIHDDVERFISHYQGKIHGLVMDPTREGASQNFLNALLKLKPEKIVYISCEPKTQVRDLNVLAAKYSIDKVVAVDMFSQTVHVETIVLLSLKTA